VGQPKDGGPGIFEVTGDDFEAGRAVGQGRINGTPGIPGEGGPISVYRGIDWELSFPTQVPQVLLPCYGGSGDWRAKKGILSGSYGGSAG